MLKKILATCFVLMISLTFVFAGGASEKVPSLTLEDAKKQPTGKLVISPQLIGYENAKIELTWQPVPAHSMVSTQQSRVDDIYMKAEKWIKKYPNVKIVPVGTTSNVNDNMTKLRVAVVEGGAPDLCAVDSFMMPLFKQYAQPIQDVVAAAGIDVNDFFPYVKSTVLDGENLLALWYTTDVRGLYYRKDLVEKVPTTVDELISTGKALADKGYTGLIYLGGRDEATVNNTWGLYWSTGEKLVNEDGSLGFASGSGREAMKSYLDFFSRTISEGITPKSVLNYTQEADMYGDITSGKVAMFIGGSWAIAPLRELLGKDEFDENWGLAPLPTLFAGGTSTSSAGGWTNVVFAKDELHRQLAAELAIALYSSDEAQESWCRVGGYLPTRTSQYESFEYLKNDPLAPLQLDLLEMASTRPAVELYSVVSSETQVAVGEVISGAKTSEQALDALIKNIQNY